MKWLLAIWIMTIIGLAGTYSHVIDLRETIDDQTTYIAELTTEIVEINEKEDIWYKEQIEKWVVPYEFGDRGVKGQISYTQLAE